MSRRTGPTTTTRDQVFARDRSCVMCGDTFALQVHHRRPRAAGGTRRPESNGPANLVLLCHAHHSWVESHRDLARQRGFLVRQHVDPADVALIHHGAWVWLCDDGSILPLGAADLAALPVSDQRQGSEQDGAA